MTWKNLGLGDALKLETRLQNPTINTVGAGRMSTFPLKCRTQQAGLFSRVLLSMGTVMEVPAYVVRQENKITGYRSQRKIYNQLDLDGIDVFV